MKSRLISIVGWLIMSALSRTLRVRELNARPWREGRHIFAFWHGEQFIPFYRHRNHGVAIMSSLSKDGEIQAGILQLLGYKPVRGSFSRRAERSLVEMIREIRNGRSAAFAVDGPRGPYHEWKPGAVYCAQKTGVPVILSSSAARRHTVFAKAWDKYELPLPFSRAVTVYSDPITINPAEPVDTAVAALAGALQALTEFTHRQYWTSAIPEYLDRHPHPRILIVQPSRIGDVVFALPAVAAIRKRYPHASIDWVVDERCAPILEGSPIIDDVLVFDRARNSLAYTARFRERLRGRNYDLSVDFHGLFKSALLVWWAGARFRLASSSTNGMRELSWLFSREIPPAAISAHCVQRHLAVAHALGCPAGAAPEFPISIDAPAQERVDALLRAQGIDRRSRLVVMHAGGGWTARRWRPERFAALAGRMTAELRIPVVLIGGREGGADEKGLNDRIARQAGAPVYDLAGQLTLRELCALLRRCSLYIGNEAGPMHIGMALGIPVVALLGPTDPGRTGPFGGSATVIRHAVDCQPCRNRSCRKKTCMELITVDEVFTAAAARLAP